MRHYLFITVKSEQLSDSTVECLMSVAHTVVYIMVFFFLSLLLHDTCAHLWFSISAFSILQSDSNFSLEAHQRYTHTYIDIFFLLMLANAYYSLVWCVFILQREDCNWMSTGLSLALYFFLLLWYRAFYSFAMVLLLLYVKRTSAFTRWNARTRAHFPSFT